jgi:hypothetical protein
MQIDLLEKSFKDINHDACPKVGMVISLETALGKKVAIAGNKITLVFDAACNKTQPFLAGFGIGICPCVRRNVKNHNAAFSQ